MLLLIKMINIPVVLLFSNLLLCFSSSNNNNNILVVATDDIVISSSSRQLQQQDTGSTNPGTTCTNHNDCTSQVEFCSSTGICLELTCLNWSQFAPTDENKFDDTPCAGGDAPKGTQFCGSDGNCYDYNCQNWYSFGPIDYTGNTDGSSDTLTCETYPETDAKANNVNGLVFACKKFPPGRSVPQTKGVAKVFNQKCSISKDNTNFNCYQFEEGTSFNEYQQDVARIQLDIPPCEGVGQPPQAVYWYQTTLEQNRPNGQQSSILEVGPENASSFNLPNAYKTMYAVLTSDSNAASSGSGSSNQSTSSSGNRNANDSIQHQIRGLLLGAMSWFLFV